MASSNGRCKAHRGNQNTAGHIHYEGLIKRFDITGIKEVMERSQAIDMQEAKTLLILNVALTIPAQIVIGMLVNRFRPRITFSALSKAL